MFFLHQSTFLAHNPHDRRHMEMFEREIKGTKIIHVFFKSDAFDSNSISHVIQVYIRKNINPKFYGFVNSIPSYNSHANTPIYWRIKDVDHPLIAVYFDGGSRPGIDQHYDLIDLRWLGNGSPHMYCFWKTDFLNVLKNNDVIKNNDVKNAHDGFEMIDEHTPLINKCPQQLQLMIKKFFKIMAEQVTNKVHKTIPLGDVFIAEILGKNSKKLVDAVADILNKNPDDLEAAIKVISSAEDKLMGLLDRF